MLKQRLYPMKLAPAVKEIIWGGDRLKKFYGKSAPFERLAESWELTVRSDGMSIIENGEYAGMTLGDYFDKAGKDTISAGFDADRFPLLIKFIDARDRLSIQVHPSDEYALANEGEYGKTEMWYIVEADEGAELVFGLKEDFTAKAFDTAVSNNTVEELLRRVKVHAGEVYFIPAGLVHAIGEGILICEIQQNSNVTYRVYDYGRLGKDGKPRETHVEKAREVIVNYTDEEINSLRFKMADRVTPSMLACCDKFEVHRHEFEELTLCANEESFISLTFIEGDGYISYSGEKFGFSKGDTYFIPAGAGSFTLFSEHASVITAEI